MKVTAETITDEQCDAMWREACGTGLADVNPDLMCACTVAVNRHGDFTPAESRAARALVAAAWNARHGDES